VNRPVAVCVDLPRLELDKPFTYSAPDDVGMGQLVSVPFHGRTVKGWVLGETDDVPGRILPVRRVLSRVPLFEERLLGLYRWMAERYVVPLATVIGRAHPPRVAGEEEGWEPVEPASAPPANGPGVLGQFEGGDRLLESCRGGGGAFVLRPLPDDEAAACAEAVSACLAGGRDAIVVVPEAEPVPHTARVATEAFPAAALLFVGGEPRERYRAWLDVLAGRYRVVAGSRSAVFAPVRRLGLVWVNREAHPGHREERAPYHHVREVALARARLEGAVCVLAAHGPSAEAVAEAEEGRAVAVRAPRDREREAAPLVEVVRPAEEDRSPRLAQALKGAAGAFLLVSRRGYGVARMCRACGEPARCSACGGPVVIRRGEPRCAVCGSEALCSNCGGRTFGVERGGTERLQEWAARTTALPVTRVDEGDHALPPGRGSVMVATAVGVKDFGPRRVDLVGVLDPDRARRRAGLHAAEQALATWMEAAVWAGPRRGGGRVVVHTRDPGDPAVQALVRWDPWHFHRSERRRREEAGFPPGCPVFRLLGAEGIGEALEALGPVTLLASRPEDETVCLVALRPEQVPSFRHRVLELIEEGVVRRVEAEPQL
jgi:primosomal protein N' (replication factor Y) (superfamily II helicase)